jgi:PAS domain S-box-containing protein
MGKPARILNFQILFLIVLILFTAIILFGIKKIHNTSIRSIHAGLSNKLNEKTAFIARTINPFETDIFSFRDASIRVEEFNRLETQLTSYHHFLNSINLFTLLSDEGKIIYGPSSLLSDSLESIKKGTISEELRKYAREVFLTGSPVIISPRSVPGKKTITTLSPVLDLRSGDVLMLVGAEWESDYFSKPISRESRVLYIFGFLYIAIVLVSFAVFYLKKTGKLGENRIFSYFGVFITAIAGIITTLLLVHLFSTLERNKHHDVFAQLSHPNASRISEMFTGFHDNDLIPLVRLFEMRHDVSAEDFSIFTRGIYQRFRMAGVGWAPKVEDPDRERFIKKVRDQYFPAFDIYRNVRFLGRIAQGYGDYYFPLLYLEPYEEIKGAQGVDLRSDSLRWQAVRTSIITGLPTITERINRFSNNEPSFNVYAPVYNHGIKSDGDLTFQQKLEMTKGVVYITLRLNMVLNQSEFDTDNDRSAILVDLYQIETNGKKSLLASTYRDVDDAAINNEFPVPDSENSLTNIYPLFVFGKTYMIAARPGEAFFSSHPYRIAWTTFAVGLLITILITFIHLFVTRRNIDLELELKNRARDLEGYQLKLKQVNNHFQSLAEQSGTVLWEVDSDGMITFLSDLSKKVIGYKPADLIGKRFIWELLPEERVEKFRKFIIDTFIRKKEFRDLEGSLATGNNHLLWVSISGIPILDEKYILKGYKGSLTDITERKKALDAEILLRQREDQRLLLDNIPTQIWYLTSHNTYGSVNKAHADFLGVSAGNIMFRNVYEVIPKDLADAFCKGNIQVFQNGKPLDIEVWIPHATGRKLISIHKYPKTNRNNGKVEYVVCSAEDVTEQRKAEEALRISRERYRTVTENAFVGIYLMYGRHFEFVNEKFCEITGYSRNDLTSEFFDFKQLLTAGSQEIVEKRYQARLKGQELPNNYEFEIITKNGSIKHVEISTNPLSSKDKPRILGIMQDITERNHALKLEQEVNLARRAAQFKQNFLANMSHEIRTPLTGVLGMTEMLAKTRLDKKQKDYVNVLHQSGENLKEIINMILDYSKIEAGKITLNKQQFAPVQLLKSAEKLFTPLCQGGVELKTWISDNVPQTIIADRQRLNQVINNLLSNAVKFTSKGFVTLKISVDKVLWGENGNPDYIMLKTEVIDTGIGISKKVQERLFIPFYQIDNDTTNMIDGTGLGLAISRELVKMMDGQIGVISDLGEGSNFWFTFKAEIKNHEKDDKESVGQNVTLPEQARSLNILLVEDKEVNQKVIGLLLRSLKHKVKFVSNGEEALKGFSPGKFDLILMDIKMPVMDGITATQKLKELYTELPPIVGLSASSFEGDREKYMNSGLDEYLTKPLDLDAFIGLTKKLDLY